MSFRLRQIIWVCLVVTLLAGCTQGGKYTYGYYTGKQKHTTTAFPVPEIRANQHADFHTVEKGDTLYSIAWAYGHDVRDVAAWNTIQPPYTIYPKQRIRVRALPKVVNRHTTKQRPSVSAKTSADLATRVHKKPIRSSKISWQWPTNGKIIGKYSDRDTGKKGLDIAGKVGQRIYAAARGDVVYVGSGLRGYGKLIIIRHNETYFSAYAHNRRLFVKENQVVKKGQHIADMGSSEADRAMLHFEVRRDGKPVDPLRYLPRR